MVWLVWRNLFSLPGNRIPVVQPLTFWTLTYSLTQSTEKSLSWEANRYSASQEIPHILWNPQVYYRICNSPPTVLIPRQINLVHAYLSTSWRSILIFSAHVQLGFPSGLFPSGLPTNTLYITLLSPKCATCPVQLILPDLITRIIFGGEYRSLRSSLLTLEDEYTKRARAFVCN